MYMYLLKKMMKIEEKEEVIVVKDKYKTSTKCYEIPTEYTPALLKKPSPRSTSCTTRLAYVLIK